jgi:hypothetical protein
VPLFTARRQPLKLFVVVLRNVFVLASEMLTGPVCQIPSVSWANWLCATVIETGLAELATMTPLVTASM